MEAAHARESRQAQVAKMLRDGWKPASIAKRLNLSLSTIQRDIKQIKDLMYSLGPEAFAAAKRFAQEKLLWIAREAEEAWKRSQGQIIRKRIKGKMNGKGAKVEDGTVTIQEFTSCGDPRYLEQMRAAVADYRRLLGVDAPERHEHTGPDGAPLSLLGMVQDYEAAKPEVIEAEVTKVLPAPDEEVPEAEEAGPNSNESA